MQVLEFGPPDRDATHPDNLETLPLFMDQVAEQKMEVTAGDASGKGGEDSSSFFPSKGGQVKAAIARGLAEMLLEKLETGTMPPVSEKAQDSHTRFLLKQRVSVGCAT